MTIGKVLHISSFNFESKASIKTVPGKSLAIQLLDEYLANGFTTSGDNLLVTQLVDLASLPAAWCTSVTVEVDGQPVTNVQPEGQLGSQSIGYSKGQARMLTLLATVSILLQDGVTKETFEMVHPRLYASILQINVQCIKYNSKREEIFSNFRLSHQGAIRKAPSAITWVVALEALHEEHGETDAAAVLKVWNASASKQSQIVGGKAQTVKNIMQLMDKGAKVELIKHVAEHGWESCAWTDDVLASKKMYPGFAPRGGSKLWNERQKITGKSCKLMVESVQANHAKMNAGLKRPTSKLDAENLAAQAALAYALVAEVKGIMPISEDILEAKWLAKFAEADAKVTSELAMALAEKSEKFMVHDIATLAEIMNSHSKVSPIMAPLKMVVEKSELEKSTFELNMKQMEYDLQAWRVLDQKLSSYVTAVAAVKTDWRLNAWKENLEIAQNFFQNHCLTVSWEQDSMMPLYTAFKSSIEKKLQLAGGSCVSQNKNH
jgi:hypothetical protein